MLVIARKNQERIVIRDRETGAEIWIKVSQLAGAARVKLGFDAPQRFAIRREELKHKEAAAV